MKNSIPLVLRILTSSPASRAKRVTAITLGIGLAVAGLGLTGCEPVNGSMPADPPSIVGEWDVYQYQVSITGTVQANVDLTSLGSDITVRFNESPRSYSFAYHPPLQGVGPAAEVAAGNGTYVQDESRNTLTLTGRSLAGAQGTSTYDYTLSSAFLRLHLTESFFHTTGGSTQSGTRTVTIMARR